MALTTQHRCVTLLVALLGSPRFPPALSAEPANALGATSRISESAFTRFHAVFAHEASVTAFIFSCLAESELGADDFIEIRRVDCVLDFGLNHWACHVYSLLAHVFKDARDRTAGFFRHVQCLAIVLLQQALLLDDLAKSCLAEVASHATGAGNWS